MPYSKKTPVELQTDAQQGQMPAVNELQRRAQLKTTNRDTAECQYILSYLYGVGLCVAKNEDLQIKWARKASANGHAMASFLISENYRVGESGLKQNAKQAYNYCETALQQSPCHPLPDVSFRLGTYYMTGLGGKQDKATGFELIANAAAHGYAPAQAFLESIGFKDIANAIETSKLLTAFNEADHVNR
ncbi:MAG: TPR repeat protein [Alphaproteobacteria bacterium]|jgi:TPR repeat protein